MNTKDIKDFVNKLRKVAMSDPVAQQNLDAAITYLDLAVFYETREAEEEVDNDGAS